MVLTTFMCIKWERKYDDDDDDDDVEDDHNDDDDDDDDDDDLGQFLHRGEVAGFGWWVIWPMLFPCLVLP